MTNDDDQFLRMLYAAVTRDDAFATMLELFAKRFQCVSAVLIYADPHHPEVEVAMSFGILSDPAVQQRYLSDYRNDDPAPGAMMRLRVGEANATDRLFTPALKFENRFIREFYHPLGLRETMGGPIANESGRFGIIAVHRGDDRPPFSDEDISAFERIMGHIIQVMELRRAFFEIGSRARSLQGVVERSPVGIMIFDHTRRLRQANAVARQILDRADGFVINRSGHVRLIDAKADASLQRLFVQPALATSPALIRVAKAGGSDHYVIRASSGIVEGERRDPGLSLHISEPQREAGDVAAPLSRALGMTEAAARLTSALLNGEDIASYAVKSGISLNTAKFHLKSAFAATGARRQSELVRIASVAMRDLGLAEIS